MTTDHYKAVCIEQAVMRNNLAGHKLTEFLIRLLRQSGYNLDSNSSMYEMVDQMKQKCCKVALDYEQVDE